MGMFLRKTIVAAGVLVLLSNPASIFGSKAIINSNKVLVIDGKPVFPIGFSLPPPIGGKTPSGKDGIKEIADAGATFLRTPTRLAGDWNEKMLREVKESLAAARKHKMYCWLALRDLSEIEPGDAKKEKYLRDVVNQFKDHPGMGVWKGSDEPAWGKLPIAPLEHAYKIVKEEDPHHPVVVIHAPRGTVDSLRPYNAAADIVGTDIYPIAYPPGLHTDLTNKEMSIVGDYTKRMYELAGPDKGVWMTLQIVWSGVSNPGKTLRFPTFHEQRFMTYDAIINGARGLMYFGPHIESSLSAKDKKLGWHWQFWNNVQRRVVQEIGSKSPLYPALLEGDSQLPVRCSHKDIEFCVREVGEDIFIIAAKRTSVTTLKVDFTGLPADVKGGEMLFEEPRKVQQKDGKFSDWFAPFEVHVYRFHKTGK